MITLYIKEHNMTGLKYFGKTSTINVDNYAGSGLYWKRHFDNCKKKEIHVKK